MGNYTKGLLLLNTEEDTLNNDSKADKTNQIFICKVHDDIGDECYRVQGFMCSTTMNNESSDLLNFAELISELHIDREDSSEIHAEMEIDSCNILGATFGDGPAEDDSVPSEILGATFGDGPAEDDSVPSEENICKALQQCDLKYRAIILLMSSSGMGSGDIRGLTFGDFIDAISDYIGDYIFNSVQIGAMMEDYENLVGTWSIHNEKTGKSYYTFSTRQSIMAIISYLHERELKDDITLIRGDVLFENCGKEISAISFTKNFQMINDTAILGFSGRQRYLKSHALRKYFVSTLLKNGISQIIINCFLGHDKNGINAKYFQFEPSTLKEEYLGVVEELSIVNDGYNPGLHEEVDIN